jgi:hypothetical protein
VPEESEFTRALTFENFRQLDTQWALELLKEMLAKDIRSNLQICVQVATKYSEFMTPAALMNIFEEVCMLMCVCMYVCMYGIYVCVYVTHTIYIEMCVCVCIYIYRCMCVCVCVCVCV